MKALALFFSLNTFVWVSALATEAEVNDGLGTQINAQAFFASIKGNYKIDMVAGEKPHDANAVANADLEDGQGVLTMPYCPPGGACDPGWNFFEWPSTQVFQQDNTYTILVSTGGKTLKYYWQDDGPKVLFRNFQYTFSTGAVVTLDHVLLKFTKDE